MLKIGAETIGIRKPEWTIIWARFQIVIKFHRYSGKNLNWSNNLYIKSKILLAYKVLKIPFIISNHCSNILVVRFRKIGVRGKQLPIF